MGSLRDVRLVRGSKTVSELDLYDYLLSGIRDGDAVLRDGDTVFVPPRALTVSIEGAVRRPLTYELKQGEGLNAASGEYGDMVKAGVLDPTVVTRSALQNAASIAKNILVTEAIIAEPAEEGGAGMPAMPDMGGMGGMM